MKFSIRTLLVLTLAVAVAIALVMKLYQSRVQQERLLARQAQLQSLRAELQAVSGSSEMRQAMADQQAMYQRARKDALDHFAILQARDSKIEDRGPGVVSLRSVPEITGLGEGNRTSFRVRIPADRQVWLKYVAAPEPPSATTERLDELAIESLQPQPMESSSGGEPSGFQHPGGYAFPLPTGEHVLTVTSNRVESDDEGETVHEFRIQFGDQVLLQSSHHSSGTSSFGTVALGSSRQSDYRPGKTPHRLLRLRFNRSQGSGPPVAHLWLGEQSSDLPAFPGLAGQPLQ